MNKITILAIVAAFMIGTSMTFVVSDYEAEAGEPKPPKPPKPPKEVIVANTEPILVTASISANPATIDLLPLGTIDGAINPQSRAILFYGDILCEIEASGSMYIQFGGDTTVKQLDDCTSRNGNPINLDPPLDTVFHEGDILVLERITPQWEQVFKSQS